MRDVKVAGETEITLAQDGAGRMQLPKTMRVNGQLTVNEDFARCMEGCDSLICEVLSILDAYAVVESSQEISTNIVCGIAGLTSANLAVSRRKLSSLVKNITFCDYFRLYVPAENLENWVKDEYDVFFLRIPGVDELILTRKGDESFKKRVRRSWLWRKIR